jgi:hypothetical protein
MRISICFCSMAILATAACGHNSVKINPDASAALASRWNGTLAVPQEMAGVIQIRGSASLAAEGSQSVAAIEIHNATRGGVHPWHVHLGRCGSGGAILGDASAYPLLKVGGDGKAEQSAKLAVPLPYSGEYSVNVHASAANMGTVVACSNLAPPARQ